MCRRGLITGLIVYHGLKKSSFHVLLQCDGLLAKIKIVAKEMMPP